MDEECTLALPYATLEHAYQANKTFDLEERERIRTASTAGLTKKFGREATLRPDWEEIKDDVMLYFLRKKFSNDFPDLKQKLVDTGDAILVEGNTWHDNHFGVCVCVACGSRGNNMLGTLLMKVRSEIQ